jgi:hypothetical protein
VKWWTKRNPVDEILERYEGHTLRYKWKTAYESDDDSSLDFGFKVE